MPDKPINFNLKCFYNCSGLTKQRLCLLEKALSFILRNAFGSDIEKIKFYANMYNLDAENITPHKMYVAESCKNLAGFGRYKCYGNISEISTIGVLENFRGIGIGLEIVNKLIDVISTEEVWLTTIKPDYFRKFGFELSKTAPDQLVLKTERLCEKYNKNKDNNFYMFLFKG